jgi:ABC-type glycerol-3-phosphate transport system permease component
VALAVTGFQVSTRALAGDALARFNFRGQQAIVRIVLATRVIPLPLQAIPIFRVFKWGHPLPT